MAIFAVIAPENAPKLDAAIGQAFPDHYKIAPGQFLVSVQRVTTEKVGEKLGVSGGPLGRVLIVKVSNWTGWHDRDMWEWLNTQIAPGNFEGPQGPDPELPTATG